VLGAGFGVLAGLAAGCGAPGTRPAKGGTGDRTAGDSTSTAQTAADVYGRTQAGIARPERPQSFGQFQIADLADVGDISFLPGLGRRVAQLVSEPPPDLLPSGASDLTVTIGLGPRVVHALNPSLPGAEPLPMFQGDEKIPAGANGGDLLISCCADDPSILPAVVNDILGLIPDASRRWSQFGYRGPSRGPIGSNPLGFVDGISVPRTAQQLADNVWMDGALGGATICVMRRLRLRITDFTNLPVADRAKVIGRRPDGVPLSGGTADDEVNLDAKNPDGTYQIPVDAHVRLASPLRTGSHHMLRRSYSFDNGSGDAGLLFTCYQRELRTFAITQQQLDHGDRLMQFVQPTGSAAFLILPGFTESAPLGSQLRAAALSAR
jgi:dye decolorizing peroxidase